MQMNLIPESPQAVICNQSKLNKYRETLNNIIETLINNVYTHDIILKLWRSAPDKIISILYIIFFG